MTAIRYLLFFGASVILFFSGIYFERFTYIAVIVAIIAFLYLFVDYVKNFQKINKKIDGVGVRRIIASDKEPGDPKKYEEGDLHIKYKEKP